jgi:hypothetical protein
MSEGVRRDLGTRIPRSQAESRTDPFGQPTDKLQGGRRVSEGNDRAPARGVGEGVTSSDNRDMTTISEGQALAFRSTIPGTSRAIRSGAGWIVRLLPKPKRDAYVKQYQRAGEAFTTAATLLSDPAATTADRDAARVAYLEANTKLEALSDDLLSWRTENIGSVSAEVLARRDELAKLALAKLEEIEPLLQEIADDARALALFRNDHPAKRDAPLQSVKRLPGGESLANLRTGIAALVSPEPKERVPAAELRARREAGEDVSRLVVAHSPDGLYPRGAGLS